MKRIVPVLVLVMTWTIFASSQTIDTRDLTIVRESTNAPPPQLSGGRYSHQRVEQAPLEVTLGNFDRLTYDMYEKITYRVVIQNVGVAVFDLPWERDWGHLIEDSNSPLLSCVLSLEVVDAQRKRHSLNGVVLYGSHSSPQTLKTLRPGEAVELIVPGKWAFDSAVAAQSILDTLPGIVSVVGALGFVGQPPGHWYKSTISTNQISVHLSPVPGAR
jgi:hypothetical protein